MDQVRNLFGASSNICDQAFHAITAGLKSQVWVPNGALAATEENTSATWNNNYVQRVTQEFPGIKAPRAVELLPGIPAHKSRLD